MLKAVVLLNIFVETVIHIVLGDFEYNVQKNSILNRSFVGHYKCLYRKLFSIYLYRIKV